MVKIVFVNKGISDFKDLSMKEINFVDQTTEAVKVASLNFLVFTDSVYLFFIGSCNYELFG